MGLGVGKSVGDSVPGLSTPNSMSLYFVFIFLFASFAKQTKKTGSQSISSKRRNIFNALINLRWLHTKF